MSFFGVNVNPFSTPVGQKIEQATDGSLPSENWTLNMEICDIINETEDGPRDAVKAIKRRLNQAAGKNYTIVMYTLTVLETCVKNCGKRFHALACSREFIQELVKLIGPKNEPPTVVQEKVLSLIQTWADTFRTQPHTQGVVQVYQELKAKGMQFPMTDLDNMAPIITPERSVPETEQSHTTNIPMSSQGAAALILAGPHQQGQQPHQIPQALSNQPVKLNEEQLAKLQSEIDVVQGNMHVLSEMLTYFTSSEGQGNNRQDCADLELLTELHATCKAMQERIVDLIGKLDHDELTAELLRINDELNNLFLRYSRFTKNKTVPASAILAQTIAQPANVENPLLTKEAESLIDLSDGMDGLEKQLGTTSLTEKGEKSNAGTKEKDSDKDEFDMFAQSRNASYETMKKSSSKYEDNLEVVNESGLSSAILNRGSPKQPNISSDVASSSTFSSTFTGQSDYNNMSAWSNATPGAQTDQSLTSSEFERFLAERAAAVETQPNLSTTTVPTATTPRQVDKDKDKSLYAL